jgi:hypothetical protein
MWDKFTSWVEQVYADVGLWHTLGAVVVVVLLIAGLMYFFGINPGDWLP